MFKINLNSQKGTNLYHGGGGVGGVLQIYFEIDKRLQQVSCWMGDPACNVLCHLNLHVQPSNKTPKILSVKGLIRKSTTLHVYHIVFLHFKISKW